MSSITRASFISPFVPPKSPARFFQSDQKQSKDEIQEGKAENRSLSYRNYKPPLFFFSFFSYMRSAPPALHQIVTSNCMVAEYNPMSAEKVHRRFS